MCEDEWADEYLLMGLRLAEGISMADYSVISGNSLDSEKINFLEQIGMERVAAYSLRLARYLKKNLEQIEGVTVLGPGAPAWESAITTFKIDRIPFDDLFRHLFREHKLRCRVVPERGLNALRVSTHVFNDFSECDRVIEATTEALNKA